MSHRALNSEQFAGRCPECGDPSPEGKACPHCHDVMSHEAIVDAWSGEHGGELPPRMKKTFEYQRQRGGVVPEAIRILKGGK